MLRVIQKGKGQFIYVRRGGKVKQFCLKCAQIITGVRNKKGRLLEQYKETPWVMFPK
jgi:ribosomal protein L24E